MALVQCLYCNADNDPRDTGAYCEQCGKRLPTSAMIQPRKFARSGGTEENTTVAQRQERAKAPEALLTATILLLVAGGLFLMIGPVLFKKVPDSFVVTVLGWTVGPALVLAPLVFAARRWHSWPGPVALGLYLVWTVIGLALDLTFAVRWLPVSLLTLASLAWACWVGQRVRGK